MNTLRGITSLYYEFLHELNKPTLKKRVAGLQLTGRLEDYLCKEFAAYILRVTKGRRLALTNFGNKGEQRIDLAVFRRQAQDDLVIDTLIEAKYLRNRHRFSDADAKDEIKEVIRKLAGQCGLSIKATHGGCKVKLASKNNDNK